MQFNGGLSTSETLQAFISEPRARESLLSGNSYVCQTARACDEYRGEPVRAICAAEGADADRLLGSIAGLGDCRVYQLEEGQYVRQDSSVGQTICLASLHCEQTARSSRSYYQAGQ